MDFHSARSAGFRKGVVATAAWGLVVAGIALLEPIGLPATRLIETLLVFLALAVSAWAWPGRLRNGLVVACSLVFGFALLEGGLLIFAERAPLLKDASLGGPRPIVGWGPTKAGTFRWAKTAADGKVIYDTRVTIDGNLNRKTLPEGARPIAFLGDSWIFGDGLNDDATLPQAFADLEHRQIPVLNLSYNGWSPATNLAALQAGLDKDLLRAPRHFILFTATFHLERTACKADYATSHAPRYVLAKGTLAHAGTCADANGGWLAPAIRFLQKFEIYRRFAPRVAMPDRHDVDTYVKIIETFASEARRLHGVETTVLLAPFRDEYIKASGYTEADIVATLRRDGVDVFLYEMPPTKDLALYWIPGDEHPTALTNRIQAARIDAHLREVDPKALEAGALTVPAAPSASR